MRKFSLVGFVVLFVVSVAGAQDVSEVAPAPAPASEAGEASEARRPVLRVGVKEAPPFAMEAGDEWDGISVRLWERIAEKTETDFEYVETDLEGLIDKTATGELDVAVGALTITAEREQVVDFSHPFYHTGLGIAVRVQSGGSWAGLVGRLFSWQFFSAVFALAVLLLGVGLVLWLVEHRRNPEQFGKNAGGIGSAFWWSAVTMTTVGYGDKAPITLPGRLVAIVWMFASILLISTFTAGIASALTAAQFETEVAGPNDLHRVRVATLAESTSAAWLDDHRVTYATSDSLDEALQRLADDEVDAVVYDAPLLKYRLRQRNDPALSVLPQVFAKQSYGYAIRPDAELREPINQALLELLEEPVYRDALFEFLGEK